MLRVRWVLPLLLACACGGKSGKNTPEGVVVPAATAGATGASGAPPGPFTAWTPCQTLTSERAPRAPHALAASADLRWLAILDAPLHYPGDPALTSANDSEFQSVALWNLPSITVALRITNVSYGYDVDLSPDGAWVAISGDGAHVIRTLGSGARPLSNSQIVWEYPPPPDVPSDGSWVRNLAFSPDGTLLASGRYHDVSLVRTDSGVPVNKLVTKVSSPGVAFSPDGLYLASSAPSLWRVEDAMPIWAPRVSDSITACEAFCVSDHWATFSPDGTLLLTQLTQLAAPEHVTWETTTTLLDATSGAALRSLGGGLPRRPSFSPDGRWILAGDRLIDVKSGQESPLGVPAVISLFMSDGRIAAADASGAVTLLCPQPL